MKRLVLAVAVALAAAAPLLVMAQSDPVAVAEIDARAAVTAAR